ncbi:MAG: YggT family protein [Gemmatimonadales bacterium]
MTLAYCFFVLRIAVFAANLFALTIALIAWAVRTRRISPFNRWASTVRRWGDPLVRATERRLLASGGDPTTAPWWLLGTTLVGGLLLLSVAQWLVEAGFTVQAAAESGPVEMIALAINVAYGVVVLALVMRVLGSWFGIGRWTRWMRPAYQLTDWIVRPLSRLIPPLGMFDVSPLVAWLLLWMVRGLVVYVLLRA